MTTQVTSRHGNEPESQIVPKRPHQEDRLVQHSIPSSIPRSIVSNVQGFGMLPAIRRVQDDMSNWMSSLIQAQDGCLQMFAQRATTGRVQQEQLAQNLAQRAMMPSTSDQVSCLHAQLAHREAQLEQVRAERDNHFVQEEEEVLAHLRLLSSEAWINFTKRNGDRLKPTSKLYVNPIAPKRSPSHPSCRRQIWNTSSSILFKRDSYRSRHKPYDKLKKRSNKQQQ